MVRDTQYYDVLEVAVTANEPYRQQALRHHPDKNENDGEQFKLISKAYQVLSEPEKRKLYDECGVTDDDNGNLSAADWMDVWRAMFKKVTKEDIDNFLKEYGGSQREMEDIRDAYVKHKGNMDHIMSTVIGADEGCEDKIREVIQYYVDLGEVEMYPKFFKEPLEKREKRKQRAKREAKAAAKALKDLEKKSKSEDGAGNTDLVSLIHQRQGRRFDDLIAGMEKRYATAPSGSKKTKIRKRRQSDDENRSLSAEELASSSSKRAKKTKSLK